MKKKLLILTILILTLLVGNGQTNVYHPFPDSLGKWNEHYTTQYSQGYYMYAIFGDTIINSINYHKVYRHSENMTPSDTVITESNSDFVGGIREDSIRRIYFYNKNSVSCCAMNDSIYLLYDFSKQVGDTIFFDKPQGYTYPYLILNSIDSVLVNDQYRKRYNFQGETWIEGIGSVRDLLSSIMGIPTCYCINEMVCYKYGETTYYLNPIFHDCFPFLGNNVEPLSQQENISFFPNPTSSQAFLQVNRTLKNAILTVYNSYGQIVKQIENISGQTIILNRDNLTRGLYFLCITEDNKTFLTDKLLIIDN